MAVTVEVYKTRNIFSTQPWRWRALAANGRKLAHGGEAYSNLADLQAAVKSLFGEGNAVYLKQPGDAEPMTLRPEDPSL